MTTQARNSGALAPAASGREISLVDLLDRLLGKGVVIAGEVTISLSGVDLIQVKLNALITSVRAESQAER